MITTYLCPALMDWLIFFAVFAVFYRAGEINLPHGQTVALAVLFQTAYLLACPVMGRILTRRNAKPLLIIGVIGSALSGALALVAASFSFMLAAMLALGIVGAIFFNAFQTYMRGEAPPGGLTRSVAAYTLAWSGGAACGQLFSGILYKLGPLVLVPSNLLIGVIILMPLLVRKTTHENMPSAEEHTEQGSPHARPVNPAYVLIGWLMIFTATFVQRPIQTFVPALSAAAGTTPAAAGLLLFMHMLIQALFGFAMIKWRDWLYRRMPIMLIQGLGVIVLVVLVFAKSYPVLLVGLSILGVYAGFVYFCSVYYAGNSGNRSRNVGINELLVGFGSVIGLLASEAWLRRFNEPRGIYLVSALALAISTALQILIASKSTRRTIAAARPAPIQSKKS